jgi:hypothetical protein
VKIAGNGKIKQKLWNARSKITMFSTTEKKSGVVRQNEQCVCVCVCWSERRRVALGDTSLSNVSGLKRKNEILRIIEEHEGISQSQLLALCFVKYGWSKRVTRESVDLLVESGIVQRDESKKSLALAHTLTHTHPSLDFDLR